MRTRSKSYPNNSNATIPRRSKRRRVPNIVEPENRTIEEVVPMADRTMEELLQAPTEGYGEAIGAARIWYEKEPHNLILTWDDLVNKFVNQFFPPSKTTHIKNEICRFTQRFEETFGVAWECCKEMLRACLHHGFSELTQIDTFYNGLNEQDHDSLNAAAGGNLLSKTTKEALKIIENKLKVRYSRSKSNVSRVNTNSKDSASKTDDRIDKLANQISNLVEIVNKQVITPATAKSVEKTCVICECAHAYYDCIATDSNQPSVCAETGTYNQVSLPNRASNQIPPPSFAPVQNNPNRSITHPKGVAEDVFVKVGKFHFPTEFVVVDFEADPRVPLILGRYFLRTGRALIDVYGEEITLKVNDESVTFNLNQTMRYSSMYDDNSVNRVDVIDIACEEFVQDMLDFQYNSKSSNPTLVSNPLISESDFCKEPIVKSSSPTLTSFGERGIIYLEKLLNDDPFQLPSMDLKQEEKTNAKPSIEQPPELELKELAYHLEYAFLEDTDKLPVIIEKDLKDVEKEALIKVLKSHKRAIAWKISDIKGIDLRFCTHKILMEEDYKPAVQSQKRVNPKIHDVIKKEVIKLLDAGMIYPISDSPWVSLIHCVPKKGGMNIVANENNELIPTRLVTGWRVCIDYRKLNDATRKDNFSLPFMDQMLERLARNEFYCFLDGFSWYFQIPIVPQDKRKQLSHALTKLSLTVACPSACVMLPKEMLAVVYAFEKFRPYLLLPKTIVYTDHSALKYLLNKQDAKPRLLQGVLLLQEFDITIRDKKGSENLAADHLSRLENAHKDVLENKDINENFPLENLGSLSCGSTPWFSDIAIFHAGNFIKKGLKSLFSRFGTPRAIINDRGAHFCNDQFTRVMIKYGTPIDCTPYKLVYGKSCHLPNELEHKAYWALKHVNFDLKTAGDHRKLQLNELNALRDQAYENSLIYKERTKKKHESKIKYCIFNVGDQVLLFNSRLKIFSGKLKTRWSGPFTITQVFSYGTVELSQPNGPNFKVNGHRVKHYYGGDIPSNVVPDLHTFPMDK
nr:reverse transcriptase domain-containing protein [Tanacetum cinerariifolium]